MIFGIIGLIGLIYLIIVAFIIPYVIPALVSVLSGVGGIIIVPGLIYGGIKAIMYYFLALSTNTIFANLRNKSEAKTE